MQEMTNEQMQMIRRIMEERGAADRREKTEQFRRLNKLARKHQILFVGSSLMEQFPVNELLMDYQLPYAIYNRGIGGTTTYDLLENMDACVYDLEPDYIYINIGTNDMNRPDYTEEGLMERYRCILEGIKTHLPGARIFMLAYYPVNPVVAEGNPYMREALKVRSNARIDSANQAVERLAAQVGAQYLDLNDGLKDEDGNLKAEYTKEGMHMYADGYAVVLEALLPWLPGLKEG